MKRLWLLAPLAVVAGCDLNDEGGRAPTTVIVQTPASDSGLSVLLTVAFVAAFLFLVAAAVFVVLWIGERRRRLEADEVVVEVTGLPVSRARLALATRGPRLHIPDRAVITTQEDRTAIPQ